MNGWFAAKIIMVRRPADPGAMWTDFATGLEHWMHWERIAIVTDVEWIRNTMMAFGFLMPGEMQLFSMADKDKAREWITGQSASFEREI